MKKINTIVIHHSGNSDNLEKIKHLHININGWDDIGYHYLINRNGKIINGRGLGVIGAHVKGFNENSIGICLLGNFDKEILKENQLKTLNILLKDLMNKFNLEIDNIKLHREFPNVDKTCPGNNITKEMIINSI